MSDIAIRVENLSKKYRLGRRRVIPNFQETLLHALSAPARWMRGERKVDDTFWALKDVSYGRIASLLEVGTGFHSELTGRDNIYLNGAILGMSQKEIGRKFDEIVDFSGVEKFLDTPVKHYSSGMYVRLAFAVAAHLEPEILVVDEVLAVGDAEFQKKCLGKMGDVTKEGRTVLFVSHNMGAITQLCPNAILLNKGMLETYSTAEDVVKQYLSSGTDSPRVTFDHSSNPNAAALITRLWIGDSQGEAISIVDVNKSFTIGLEILGRQRIKGVEISIRIFNSIGHPLFTTNLNPSGSEVTLEKGLVQYLIPVPSHFLAPDTYSISVAIHKPFVEFIDQHENAISFDVKETGSQMWRYKSSEYGNILVDFPWQKSD
ncbi:MAG: ABC transporter ATP-binding protein [Chloroflexi bacterium]|nr:ABC transporter ATP-binding protein [Chloroflexota bacterium]